MNSETHTYRAEIDGLRGIAVASVVLFHIDPAWLPAGFIGVDMFFVISGFLITQLIARDLARGEFDLQEFYRRRIRRIVPVLALVVVTTLLAGAFILLPADLQTLGHSAIAAQAFLANVYFTYFLDTSYFAESAALQPLLHLWSLSVEEQFYALWPLVLLMLFRVVSTRWLLAITSIAIAASVTYGELAFASDPLFQYYMLPARAAELLIGAIAALWLQTQHDSKPPWSSAMGFTASLLGLGLVTLSLILVSADRPFPGVQSLPVTVGTALLLLGGLTPNPVTRLLAHPALVSVGLISYSLYLWHWPVLAFAKYANLTQGLGAKFAWLLLICLLSVLSYRYVETPARKSNDGFYSTFIKLLCLPTALVLLLSVAVLYGMPKLPGYETYLASLDTVAQEQQPASNVAHVCQRQRVTEKDLNDPVCVIQGTRQPPRIILWGDSNAAHYVDTLGVLARHEAFSFRNISHQQCPPLLASAPDFVDASVRQDCAASIEQVDQALPNYDVVILSASWDGYLDADLQQTGTPFADALAHTIQILSSRGQQVLLLGRIARLQSFDRRCEAKAVKLPFLDCTVGRAIYPAQTQRVNQQLADIARSQSATYVDFNHMLCTSAECSAYIDGQLVYWDSGHLSLAGAEILGKALVTSGFRLQVNF